MPYNVRHSLWQRERESNLAFADNTLPYTINYNTKLFMHFFGISNLPM